jgi:hypothetical protein
MASSISRADMVMEVQASPEDSRLVLRLSSIVNHRNEETTTVRISKDTKMA